MNESSATYPKGSTMTISTATAREYSAPALIDVALAAGRQVSFNALFADSTVSFSVSTPGAIVHLGAESLSLFGEYGEAELFPRVVRYVSGLADSYDMRILEEVDVDEFGAYSWRAVENI